MSVQDNYSQYARDVIQIEMDSLSALHQNIPPEFDKVCELFLRTQGKIIVTGIGKSGHIARKITATFSSTGTPAMYLHPSEAGHGDLGVITPQDTVLAISYSGESTEILTFLPLLKRNNVPIVCMTGNVFSSLAQLATFHLDIGVEREACPLNLAPTASTTVTLVLGDALAVALLEARGFNKDDFAATHPAGRLGKRLLTRVKDIMHTGAELPIVASEMKVAQALLEMSNKKLGMTSVVESNGTLCGVFTDGDLRRALGNKVDLHNTPICAVMTTPCHTINADVLATEALYFIERNSINGLVVVDDRNCPIGMFNMHDLLRAGVV